MVKYYKSFVGDLLEDRPILSKVELKCYNGLITDYIHYEYDYETKCWWRHGIYDHILYNDKHWKEITESEMFLELL